MGGAGFGFGFFRGGALQIEFEEALKDLVVGEVDGPDDGRLISRRSLGEWGMKKPQGRSVWVLSCVVLAVFLAANGGCASKPKPDWDQRVGHLTFDQAVGELGAPVAVAPLDDGSRVAEWFLKPGPSISFGLGTGVGGGGAAVGVGQSVALPTKGQFLRLVFGPDGQLQRWEKFRR